MNISGRGTARTLWYKTLRICNKYDKDSNDGQYSGKCKLLR